MKKIAINGFGRIGRLVFRRIFEENAGKIEVVAINDLTDAKTLAHLLKHDTALGKFKAEISVKGNEILVNGRSIPVYAERDPKNLPWKSLGIDVVVESTGFFRTKETAGYHIEAGAKKVVISAPAGKDIKTVVYGVNDAILTSEDTVISGASCTTNCLAPIIDAVKKFGIIAGTMTTVHAYTADQRLQDAPHSDLRRARAAAQNIIPTATGAAAAIGLVIPECAGKLDGYALRVPVITGSVVDITLELEQSPSLEEINAAVEAKKSETLEYSTDPLVSSDIIGNTHSSIFDSGLTNIVESNGKRLYKLVSWYDNEMSYVSQFVRTLTKFALI